MKAFYITAIVVISTLVSLAVFANRSLTRWEGECAARGGVLIRAATGYECVRMEKVK